MSTRQRRVFEPEFKLSAVERLISGEPIEALAAELGVTKLHLYKWRLKLGREGVLRRAGRPGRSAVAGEAEPAALRDVGSARKRMTELERKIGQQQLELDFFRQALRRVGGARRPSEGPGVPTSTRSSRR
jgi:transposase-like protein